MENERIIFKAHSEALEKLLKTPSYTIGAYSIDVQKKTLTLGAETTRLTNKELHLLILLAANPNVMLERKYLLETIWDENNYFNGRSMDVYLCKLRKLLKADTNLIIINIHGKGYKLIAPSK
ncbi:putative two component transcriptional regulator, winged helix family [Paludibacter propionicigenes WB4]|uniref:Putative two component transcriptional regulator, winged helix family n=1 Tax=Paludibacter propionicigenes (strain DSM 17365 / JCM 13257 / WB4) TaxID=694427 RepID=E4T1X5_PALPW|nr:winged helix-turn-helix domain-containing protein [Paludibacter propionicigenes]ADQ78719.1 putative two component transcriptional regulator, winged helix family [Paludibacter propionicigenes WB4]